MSDDRASFLDLKSILILSIASFLIEINAKYLKKASDKNLQSPNLGWLLFLVEFTWHNAPTELYFYICLYLLNSLCVYKCYICIYWSAYIYLNYNLVPFNIKNLDGLKTHRHVFWALFFHVSPLLLCHTYSQL